VKALAVLVALAVSGCTAYAPSPPGRFTQDVSRLRKHGEIVVLTDPVHGAQVAVSPTYQGRVMTSTTGGPDLPSFGWIGWGAVASRARQPHMNVFGGEDRFWLGPEGGQYALYFKAGDPFDLDHWQVPEAIDWGAWEVTSRTDTAVGLHRRMALTNYSNARFDIDVDRQVRLLADADVASTLEVAPGQGVRTVAFESSNTVTNAGAETWQPASGLVSVWILGQFNPSRGTTIALPIAGGPEGALGPAINDRYFGKVPADRLAIQNLIVFFRGDGQYRSKIGVPPRRAMPLAGSYDSVGRVLTLVQYTRPSGARAYVNSMWELQRDPYSGDVVNSYNDGPPAPGKPPLGPFYELETSSPALALAPGERYTHVHRTFHFTGPEAELDRLARATLKAGVDELARAFESR
jgi:hypothetical protein